MKIYKSFKNTSELNERFQSGIMNRLATLFTLFGRMVAPDNAVDLSLPILDRDRNA